MSSTSRILVTGCAGFIGGHTVDALLDQGHEVVGVDDFSTGSPENMARSWGRFRFLEGNICEPAVSTRAVDGVERIIHLASVPSVPLSVANPLQSAHASIIGTVTLLDAARKAGVLRVVQASSSSAYGDGETLPRVETLPPSPMSPYAVAKLTQEYYGKAFYLCYGLECVSLRYFNVFGPRQRPDSQYAAVIPKFIAMMRSGKRPEIYGDGEQTRDFTYIDNVVEANIRAALAKRTMQGEPVNIGTGTSFSLNCLVDSLNRILGTDLPPVHLPVRTGDVRDSLADIRRAGELFGYQPKVGFEEGLRRTAASMPE